MVNSTITTSEYILIECKLHAHIIAVMSFSNHIVDSHQKFEETNIEHYKIFKKWICRMKDALSSNGLLLIR